MNIKLFRRKKSLIDEEIQFGIARIIFKYLLLYTLFFILTFAIPIWWLAHHTHGGDIAKATAVGQFVMDGKNFWFLLALFIVGVCFHSIAVTRKFAGPIFVFRRQLQRLQNGEISKVQLRENDYLHGMKNEFNAHLEKLGNFLEEMSADMNRLEDTLKPENGTPEKIPPEDVKKIQNTILKMRTALNNTWKKIN